jgi:hypothetical protein
MEKRAARGCAIYFQIFNTNIPRIVVGGQPLGPVTLASTNSPIPWLHRSKVPNPAMGWLAWNIFVEFVKLAA